MVKILSFTCSILLSINCFAQTYWRIENERGEELLLTINIDEKKLTFETYTRKNALREMAGSLMYMVAKTAGKIRYPELMHGEGKISFVADTTNYMGIIDYPDKLFSLKAKTWKNHFYGVLTDSKNKTTVLTGEKVDSDKPLRDYPSLINSAFSMVENYFWDEKLLKSSDWQNYKNEVNNLKLKIVDDYELSMTMMWLGKKLTMVPHEIRKINKNAPDPKLRKNFAIRYAGTKKAILFLNNLPEQKEEMDQLFKEIREKNIETIVLVAEGNRNMTLPSALHLAGHLTDHAVSWGCFLTRNWTKTKTTVPLPDKYESTLKNGLTIGPFYNETLQGNGFYMNVVPVQPSFKGKIYVIINNSTSCVAEALTIFLKNEKLATVAGQKSAGSPTLTIIFALNQLYRITIPFAQFYDTNGKSNQGIGVEPDLPVTQDAVGHVLNLPEVK